MKTILFVCTGNICRSPMAEGLFRHAIKGRGDYRVLSAGVGAIDGQPLEGNDPVMGNAQFVGDADELRTMVDGKRHQQRDLTVPCRRPVDMVDRLVLAQRPMFAARLQEEIEDGHERYVKRVNSSMDEIRAFYNEVFPHAEEAVAYIDKFDYAEPLPDDVANLRNLLYSLITVSLAVELWKQPRVKHSANTILTRVS